MKGKCALLCMFFFSSISAVEARQTGSLPTTGATPIPQASPLFPRGGRGSQGVNVFYGPAMGGSPETVPEGLVLKQMIVQRYAQPLYRKPTNKELEAVSPRPDTLKKYAEFLQRPNAGIFRLVVDSGCSEDSKIVTASDDCLKYTMPGAGSSFSFRASNYRIRRLADLTYSGSSLRVTGVLMHGVMVNLGDLPLENITLQTPGVKYLLEFQPITDFEKAREIDQQLLTGFRRDGFVYGKIASAAENTTYVLRAVAYRGKVYQVVHGISYNELDFDKRSDIIVAFRVVERSADGSLTIIWRQLSSADSPKMKAPLADTISLQSDKTASN